MRSKRNAAGKAKGSPLKVEIKADEWEEDVEVEVETPSKVIWVSSFENTTYPLRIVQNRIEEADFLYRNLDSAVLVLEVAMGRRT